MVIGIDTRWAEYKAGVYRVICELFKEVIALGVDDEFVLFGVDIYEPGCRPKNVRVVDISGWKRRLFQGMWKTLEWPCLEILTGKMDVVYFSNFVSVPMKSRAFKVVTVHDLAFKLFPETIEAKNLRFLEKFCERSVMEADLVHCVSHSTALDLMKFFDVKDVVVAHNALGDGFVEGEGGGGYVLFVGTLEPRKNLKELITAMEELWRGGSDLRLKIVGAKGWNEEVKVSGEFERMVEFTGFVSDEELVGLYGAAEVFVFPSFYEGFGIPLLEAMACGVAVISADNSSLREVGGDACVYFDGDLSECIKRVVGDNELKKELRERGLLRCKEFSWKESAKLLYQRSSV